MTFNRLVYFERVIETNTQELIAECFAFNEKTVVWDRPLYVLLMDLGNFAYFLFSSNNVFRNMRVPMQQGDAVQGRMKNSLLEGKKFRNLC